MLQKKVVVAYYKSIIPDMFGRTAKNHKGS